jgi:hypothetical protein
MAYFKPLDFLLPHVLHLFKNWREQEVFEWEGSRTLYFVFKSWHINLYMICTILFSLSKSNYIIPVLS